MLWEQQQGSDVPECTVVEESVQELERRLEPVRELE